MAQRIGGQLEGPPAISPNGKYVAETLVEDGEGLVTGFDTRPAGEGLGGVTVDLGDPTDGSTVTVRAVTDDGRVIVQGTHTSLLWLPLVDNSTVDLTVTAPGQQFLGSSPAGLVVTDGTDGVTDGAEGQPYLAEVSDGGELTRLGDIPAHQALVVSPDGAWLAWATPGSLGGEVTSIRSLEAQSVDATQQRDVHGSGRVGVPRPAVGVGGRRPPGLPGRRRRRRPRRPDGPVQRPRRSMRADHGGLSRGRHPVARSRPQGA